MPGRQQFGRNPSKEPPRELDDDLFRQCREFLAIETPETNIVFVEEFMRFMPLFNKELFDKMEPKDVEMLGREYNSRFSMQHPIKIITREEDPNGIYHPATRKRYKLNQTIPAMFRRVSTLNNLGKKIPTLMNAFMNASTTSSGPFDHRKEQYAHAIADAVSIADKREGKIAEQRAQFQRDSQSLMKGKPAPSPAQAPAQSQAAETGIIDWGD